MSTTDAPRRTQKQIKIDQEVLERVKKGIAWLEEQHGPDWVDHINLKTLNLRDGDRCILGQVYAQNDEDRDGYWYALDHFDLGKYGQDYGFCTTHDQDASEKHWRMLQRVWKHVLTPLVRRGD